MLRKLVVFGLVLSVACVASAINFPGGHIEMKLKDHTHLYHEDGTPVDFFETVTVQTPQGPVDVPNYYQNPLTWEGLELRGIFRLESASVVDDVSGTSTQFWSISANPNEEVTGVISDLVVASAELGPTGVIVDYAPKFLPGPIDEDGPPNPASPPAGGRVTLYVDSTPDYNIDPDGNDSPDDWVTSAYDGDPLKRLEYPSVTTLDPTGAPDAGVSLLFDLQLPELNDFMDDVSIPPFGTLAAPADGIVLRGIFGANSGTAELFLNGIRDGDVTLGAFSDAQMHTLLSDGTVAPDWAGQQSQWSDDPNALFGDAHMLTNLIWSTTDPDVFQGWYFQSQDPVDFYVIPEPATMALLGVGLLGILRRRKNKKA